MFAAVASLHLRTYAKTLLPCILVSCFNHRCVDANDLKCSTEMEKSDLGNNVYFIGSYVNWQDALTTATAWIFR